MVVVVVVVVADVVADIVADVVADGYLFVFHSFVLVSFAGK